MDKKIVSTTYVPLQPPFQIIRYSTDIAMQIGTLIVTIQNEGNVRGLGYEIETHSHPVVSYENKFKAAPNHQLSSYSFLEGAVWNSVEVKDVMTICLTSSRLPWQEFIDFLWRDIIDRKFYVQPALIEAYWSLEKLCGGVEPPIIGQYTVHFYIHSSYTLNMESLGKGKKGFPIVRSRADDIFALNAPTLNREEMYQMIRSEIAKYIMVLRNRQRPTDKLKITYETDNPDCEDLVGMLNATKVFREPLNPSAGDGHELLKAMKGEK